MIHSPEVRRLKPAQALILIHLARGARIVREVDRPDAFRLYWPDPDAKPDGEAPAVYFQTMEMFNRLGFLTRTGAEEGEIAWKITAAGIRQLALDESPEALEYRAAVVADLAREGGELFGQSWTPVLRTVATQAAACGVVVDSERGRLLTTSIAYAVLMMAGAAALERGARG